MSGQCIEVRPRKPVVIETPEGLIRIAIRERRKLEITLPGEMRAWHGDERAVKNARFLRVEDGKVYPDYEVLVPQKNENGELIGIAMPNPVLIPSRER